MQLSLRPQLITGVALVGATAIAVTPIAPTIQPPALSARSYEVSLASYANPLTAALETLDLGNNNLFGTNEPYILPAYLQLYPGIVPQFVYDALPLLIRLGYNGSDGIESSIFKLFTGPDSSAVILSDAVGNLPGALIHATQQALTGNTAGAVATLNAAIVAPVRGAGTTALAAGASVFNGVLKNLGIVLGTIPNLAAGLVNTTIGAVQLELAKAIQVGTAFVAAVSKLDVQGAWNVAVNGLLGPDGLPGLTERLTIGGGVETTVNPTPLPTIPTPDASVQAQTTTVYHPSFRVWANNAMYQVANAFGSTFTTIDLSINPLVTSTVTTVASTATAATVSATAKMVSGAPDTDVGASGAGSTDAGSTDGNTAKPAPKAKRSGVATGPAAIASGDTKKAKPAAKASGDTKKATPAAKAAHAAD